MSDSKIDWVAVHQQLRLSEQKLAEVLSPNPERIRRIQAERAARLAARVRNDKIEATVPLMIVEISGEKVAMHLTAISEVTRIAKITPVAGTDDEVRGIINLRGELYSVIDPAALLRIQQTADAIQWGVALRHPALRIVLGVNAVVRIENVAVSLLASAEDGVLRVRDEIVILLDTRPILERLEREAASVSISPDQS